MEEKEELNQLIENIKTKKELVLALEEIESKKYKEKFPSKELSQMKKTLLGLPIVKLEIAFSPSEEFLQKISNWMEKNLGKKVILDVTVNPKIIGGAIIEYQGKWRDFSLVKKLKEKTF